MAHQRFELSQNVERERANVESENFELYNPRCFLSSLPRINNLAHSNSAFLAVHNFVMFFVDFSERCEIEFLKSLQFLDKQVELADGFLQSFLFFFLVHIYFLAVARNVREMTVCVTYLFYVNEKIMLVKKG